MTLPFSSRQAVRKLREGDFTEPQADAVVEVVEDATKELVTKDYLRAELYRAVIFLAGLMIAVAGAALALAAFVID